MLRCFVAHLPLQQFAQTYSPCCSSLGLNASLQHVSQLQSAASYSTKLNPKELKRQMKSDKKKKGPKQDQQAPTAADNTSFSEEGQAVERDVTKLVLQVGAEMVMVVICQKTWAAMEPADAV